jgi:cytochrome c peroxidase
VKLSGPDGQLPAWFRDPNKSGGYQLDGRFGTLQEQALGAFRAHAEVDTDPSQRQLDDLSSFQRVLFSSPRLAAHSRALDEGASPPDADGPLNALEQQGKAVFVRSCGQCHGGVAGSTPIVQNFNGISIFRYTDIQANCPRQVDTATPPRFTFAQCPSRLQRNVRTWEVTLANGTKIRKVTNDPGRALLTGFVVSAAPSPVDDWGKFDPSPMRGISKTAPYFHNNSANTLDEVLDHYDAFFKRVAVTNPAGAVLTTDGIHQDRPFTAAERPALLAYLHKL